MAASKRRLATSSTTPAPDIFAGAGINAGPPPGTTTAQIAYVPGGYTATTAGNNCTALAGSNAPSFATQIASVIWGASATVPTGGRNTPYTDVNGKLRTSEITVSGMGHAWPAGSSGQNTNYVDATHVNDPASNYAHVQAGRAHESGGYAVANGSNQRMGLDNTFYTTTLARRPRGIT